MRIAIVTDSSCDLPQDLLYQYNIREVPFKVIVDNTVRYDNHLDFDRETFYAETLASKRAIKVEEPSVDDFIQTYKRLAPDYDGIISIHQSARFSNAVKNARAAALQGAEIYRKLRAQKNVSTQLQIRILDSQSASIGLGLLVLRAAELLYDEINFAKFANALESLAEKIFFYLIPSELLFLPNAKDLTKVSPLGAALATILDQKMIFMFNKGYVTRVDKIKGFELAIKETSALVMQRLQSAQSFDKIGIVYGGTLSEMNRIDALNAFRLELASSGLGSLVSELSPAVGFYAGPKAVGVALINADLSVMQLIGR
ncbi:MAG: DegV family protein [Chloroherpetonaceae bacterium]|nr:DegV family protein [Chloroherpetonaceae bacterium]MDW8438538.1 DegV family protein [Chloroherpetonaceae bacterium]